jgi:hypothetical protein
MRPLERWEWPVLLEGAGRFVGQVGVPAALAVLLLWRVEGAVRELARDVGTLHDAVVVVGEACRARERDRMPGRVVRRGGGIVRTAGQSWCLGEGERVGSVALPES